MEIGEREIHDVVHSIWETVLGWDIQPTAALDLPHGNRGFRSGFIQIAGAWEGVIVCIGSEALVRRAAAVMFGVPQETLTIELLHDALGELTNMVGGNLKALLPGPSFLCLPAVVEGSNYSVCIPTARPVFEAAFLSDGQPFNVKLLAAGPSTALPPARSATSTVA
jgi:chemotaxis protein CheX